MSRGLSNRNPGNIRQSAVRYKGEVRPSRDPAFKQFESMPWGYRAIFVLLDTYRIRHGLDTIRGMISRWAPPSENRTEIYIRAVADAVGIADDRPVDTRDRTTMLRMAAAISRGKRHGGRYGRRGAGLGAISPIAAESPARSGVRMKTFCLNSTQNSPLLLYLQV